MLKILSEIKDVEPKRVHGDIEGLKQSIADIGLICPLAIDESGKLLAGRRRYEALIELYGLDYEVEVIVLPVDGDQLKAFRIAIDENLKRKNLTEVEEAIVHKEYDELLRKVEGESKGGQRTDLCQSLAEVEGWSQAKTAKVYGISRQKIGRDIKIATATEEYPELAKEKSGQTVLKGYKKQKEKEEILKAKSAPQGDNSQLYCGDFRDICQSFEPSSVDCIITDPPYGEDYLPLYGALAETALRLLKPNGSILIVSGLMFLPALLDKVGRHLTYQWLLAFKMGKGTARVYPKKVCQMWKPVLWFVKGIYDGNWVTDFISSEKLEKGLDDWQQPVGLSDKLVAYFSKPNDVILDPMMGVGTTGISAISSGRRFIGCELNKNIFEIAQGRLNVKAIS